MFTTHYILGTEKSSEILTTNMGEKKKQKSNKVKEKMGSRVPENGESKGSQG